MKEARSVPVKRRDVERDRGWRWGGMVWAERAKEVRWRLEDGWEYWSLGRGAHWYVSHEESA